MHGRVPSVLSGTATSDHINVFGSGLLSATTLPKLRLRLLLDSCGTEWRSGTNPLNDRQRVDEGALAIAAPVVLDLDTAVERDVIADGHVDALLVAPPVEPGPRAPIAIIEIVEPLAPHNQNGAVSFSERHLRPDLLAESPDNIQRVYDHPLFETGSHGK